MPQYIVAQVDTLPELDGGPSNYAMYRVTAATPDAAANAVAAQRKSPDPLLTYVVPTASFVRYMSTPTTTFNSVAS